MLLALLTACADLVGSAPTEAPEADVPAQCRAVHLDRLDTDWVAVRGKAADPKVRLRIAKAGDGYEATWIDGSFTRRAMVGEKREKDVRLTEQLTEAQRAAGEKVRARLYIQPSIADCALKVFVGRVEGEVESIPPTATEFVPMPSQEGVVFSYRAADEPLFLGPAARDRAARDKQLAEAGGPKPDHELGAVPVGTWSKVEDDGDPACTYDMDLYFDDLRVAELSPRPAAAPVDGFRHWFHEWDAPFSGNHHFEIYRYRTCADGKRELISVAGIDAVLM